jgi:hypothetical protein
MGVNTIPGPGEGACQPAPWPRSRSKVEKQQRRDEKAALLALYMPACYHT